MQNRAQRDVEYTGWGTYQRKVFWASFNAWMLVSMYITLLPLTIDELEGLSASQRAYLSVVQSIGFMFGCFTSGYLTECYGRAFVFKWSVYLNLIGILGILFSCSYRQLLVFNFFLGSGGGFDSVVANALATESFPHSKSSKVTLICLAWSIGSGLSYFVVFLTVSTNILPILPWRVLAFINAMYTLYSFFERIGLKETLVFLYENNKHKEYMDTLEEIQKMNNVISTQCLIQRELIKPVKQNGFMELFSQRNSKNSILLGMIFFFAFFSFSGVETILSLRSGGTDISWVIMIQQASGILGSVLANISVDSVLGRKGTTSLGYLLTLGVLLAFTVKTDFYWTLGFTYVYYFFVNMGFFSMFTQGQELYDGNIRCFASGYLMSLGRIGSVFAIAIEFLYEFGGPEQAIIVNIACMTIVGLLSLFLKESRPVSEIDLEIV